MVTSFNNLIIQWGNYGQTNGGLYTYFPITFPTKAVSIACMLGVPDGFSGRQINCYVVGANLKADGVFTWALNEGPAVWYIVIGY